MSWVVRGKLEIQRWYHFLRHYLVAIKAWGSITHVIFMSVHTLKHKKDILGWN